MPRITPLVFQETFVNFPFMSNAPARLALLAVACVAPAQAAPYPQVDPPC